MTADQPLPSRPDHEHMAKVADGSNTSWGKLYERHQTALIRLCGTFTSDPALAEEWAQEALVRMKEKADQFQPGAELKPWLYQIARNICLENLRKHREVKWSDSVFASRIAAAPVSGPVTKAAKAELNEKVNEALGTLSEEHRTTFFLKHVDGLSREEIAVAMGVPEATVKSRLYYAVRAIRDFIGEED